jgi:acetylornithine deacetylase/succinyl-diaminopimelate desuccinylase-like protein
MDLVLKTLVNNEGRYLRELAEFVGIPSVSTDPAHAADVRRAAEWVAERLREAGPIEVETWETPRHPAVFGRWNGAPGAPTVLIYGHMDVQPADPVELWDSPPFVLTERDGRLYGRGVSDDKASMLLPILAAEAFFLVGEKPPVNLRFLFESEEEIGSVDLPDLVQTRRDALACEVALSADGGMWRPEVPSITVSSRGLAALSFTVQGPRKDLHSGRHGGGVANPLHAAAALVASLHDDGRVAVEGFYDDVEEIEPALAKALDQVTFDEKKYLAEIGAPAGFGERGYGTLARQWYRPTLEVNGLYGGYQGPGGKTVLPSEAHVKITCRLVPNQRPDNVIAKVRQHLERHCPPGHGVSRLARQPRSARGRRDARGGLRLGSRDRRHGRHRTDCHHVSRRTRRRYRVLLVQHRRRKHPCAQRVLPPRAFSLGPRGLGPRVANYGGDGAGAVKAA